MVSPLPGAKPGISSAFYMAEGMRVATPSTFS
jgi:hypothetical protein